MYPPVENPTCAAFDEYEEVPDTVPLDFSEDDITWVASKLSGAAGALGSEAIELRNWLFRFGCASEEFRVIVADLEGWMANSSPPLGILPCYDGMSPCSTGQASGGAPRRDQGDAPSGHCQARYEGGGGSGKDGVWKSPTVLRS